MRKEEEENEMETRVSEEIISNPPIAHRAYIGEYVLGIVFGNR